MPHLDVDGVRLHHRSDGAGPPVVLVHGSWDDLHGWDRLVPHLTGTHRVVRYDRRGHRGSDSVPGQGRIGEDVDDLAGVLSGLGLAPAHVVGHSYGATVVLLLALRYPQLCRTLTVHEPPLFALLAGTPDAGLLDTARGRMTQVAELITAGRQAEATRLFVDEVGFGPGTWEHVLTPRLRETFVAHADTWLDQARDPDRLALRTADLAELAVPTLLTRGDAGLPWYPPVMRSLAAASPAIRPHLITGAGHAPHLTHAAEFAAAVSGR